MTDQSFDSFLSESLPELPPMEMVVEINPFKTALRRILWGFALNAITLQFLGLDYIFPALGMILMLCGFRTLKNENTGFRICYGLSLLQLALRIPLYGFLATIYQEILQTSSAAFGINLLLAGIRILMLFAFRSAVLSVEKKAGMEARTGSINALVFWNLLILLLTFLGGEPIFLPVGILMLVFIILVFVSLARLSESLSDSGYVVTPSLVSISDKHLISILSIILLCTVILSGILGGRYRMDWQVVDAVENEESTAVKEKLLSLGYPQDALDDLSEEDLLSCQDVKAVLVEERDFYRTSDIWYENETSGSHSVLYESNYPAPHENNLPTLHESSQSALHEDSQPTLHFTDVAIQSASDPSMWQVFHHFRFVNQSIHYGTNSIQLWTLYKDNPGFAKAGEPSGRLLCNQRGGIKTSSFYTLNDELFQPHSFFGTMPASADPSAAFSFPIRCQDARGYLTYRAECLDENYLFSSWVNFTHQYGSLNYPAKTALSVRKSQAIFEPHPFATVQHQLMWEMVDGVPVISE